MSPSEVLRRISTALDQAGIAYMLTGSLASSFHGVPRSTQDIDIVIEASSEQLQEFVRSLPEAEYYADLDAALEAHRRGSLFNVIDVTTGWKIDLIIRKSRPFSRTQAIGQRSGLVCFCRERRGCNSCETGMVEASAIAKAG